MSGGRLALAVIAVAAFGAGAGAGAWLAHHHMAQQLAESERLLEQGVLAELERRAAVAAPASAAATQRPSPAAAAAKAPRAPGSERLMPEPPASWMTLEQQRSAAVAYREWVRESARLAGDRISNLNAELFMIEGQDPAWGAMMEARVRASMASDKVFEDAELRSIECRVTVCRASVLFVAADNFQALRRHGGMSPWSQWRNAQIMPVRAEVDDGTPGFHATVYLGEDFDQPRLPRGALPAGPGGP